MLRKFYLLFLFFQDAESCVFAQTHTIDSLKSIIRTANNSTKKLQSILVLCEERNSLPGDTLHKYATEAKSLATSTKDDRNIALANSYIAAYYIKNARYDSALTLINADLENGNEKKLDDYVINRLLAARAQVYIRRNSFKEAISEFYNLLDRAEKDNDTLEQVKAINGIGWVHMEMGQNDDAIRFFQNAILLCRNKYYLGKYSSVVSNLAACFNTIGRNDSAAYYIEQAIGYARQAENLAFLANALNIKADILIDDKKFTEAEAALDEALKIRKQIGDPFYIVSDMAQMSIFYAENKQTEKGIALALEAIQYARNFNLTSKLPILYEALAQNYKAAGDYQNFALSLQRVIS